MSDERAAADQVVAFWDALVLHQATENIDVEEDLAAALTRFQGMGMASPGSAQQRVWQQLQPALARQAQSEDPSPFTVIPLLPASGADTWLDSSSLPRRSRSPRALTHLATAALLIVTLLISAIALGSVRFGWNPAPMPLLGLPAPETSPIPAADPATAQGLLTEVTVPALPPRADYVGIERWTYPPASDPVTTAPLTGPMLILVTSGRLTVSLDGEGAILGGLDQPSAAEMLTPTTGVIIAGETLLVPAQARLTTSNQEAMAATALVMPIVSFTESDWTLPWDQTTIGQEILASTRGEFSPEEALIALRRTTLDPGETVPAPPAGTLQLVGAESKYLGYLTRSPDGAATNREQESLVVLIVAITQPQAS